jgi:hypothetical protein
MPTAPLWSSFCSFFLIPTPHLYTCTRVLICSTKEDSDFREIFSGDARTENSIIKFPDGFRLDFFRYVRCAVVCCAEVSVKQRCAVQCAVVSAVLYSGAVLCTVHCVRC